MRFLITLVVLAAWVVPVTAALAQSDAPGDPPADQQQQPLDQPPPGPSLQPSDYSPVLCDANSPGFRYVEVRGSGFDAWATQRLVGNLRDASGAAQVQWGSVWVSPQGGLTLEVNLCADPFRGRPALPAGTYTLSVGQGSGGALAATSIDVSPPPAPPVEGDMTAPADQPAPSAMDTGRTPTSGPRTGPGSKQQPLPLGAPGLLADGWQMVVTGVTPDAWTGIHSAIPSSVSPASDQRDFLVRVQPTYQGPGTGVFSAMRLVLVSATQTIYDQLHNGCGVVPDMVPPNLVVSGQEVRGNVCFTVRASDIGTLVLLDNQPNDGDKLYFALQ